MIVLCWFGMDLVSTVKISHVFRKKTWNSLYTPEIWHEYRIPKTYHIPWRSYPFQTLMFSILKFQMCSLCMRFPKHSQSSFSDQVNQVNPAATPFAFWMKSERIKEKRTFSWAMKHALVVQGTPVTYFYTEIHVSSSRPRVRFPIWRIIPVSK